MTDLIDAIATRSCDINEYEARLLRVQHSNVEHQKALAIGALLFFAAGLAAVYLELATGAVALLAVAAALYQAASHRQLLADMADAHWSLALFINGRATNADDGDGLSCPSGGVLDRHRNSARDS